MSGPDELDLGDAREVPEMEESKTEPMKGLGVSGVEMEQRQPSVEDINNSVYKQIQQENIRRESAISTKSGAVRAWHRAAKRRVYAKVSETPSEVQLPARWASE